MELGRGMAAAQRGEGKRRSRDASSHDSRRNEEGGRRTGEKARFEKAALLRGNGDQREDGGAVLARGHAGRTGDED